MDIDVDWDGVDERELVGADAGFLGDLAQGSVDEDDVGGLDVAAGA